MAPSMRLLLIRHGETVDNVARLYAGSRDSALTNHGFQQATRLGLHFKTIGLTFTHLFSSHRQRAAKTASKVREAQSTSVGDDRAAKAVPDVVQLPVLMEQDFGSMEGNKFFDRPLESKVSGKGHHWQENKDTAGFVDVESKGAMARRADSFLDEYLLPLLGDASKDAHHVVAVVSHGIFLSTLWKRLLLRLPPQSVMLSPELQATARPSLEHLGAWSNTGYLELHLTREGLGKVEVPQAAADDIPAAQPDAEASPPPAVSPTPRIAHGWKTTILTINGKDHLKSLKRTGGGVGSSRHDTSQKSIETFFERRKVD